ncbi:coiled-coil domain-containing protein 191 [Rhynchocyon petersi]
MLLASREGSASGKRNGLNGWKRLTRKLSPKPAFDPDNVEQWMKKVEKASDLAVSKPFSIGNSTLPRRFWGQIIDLGTYEHIEDNDEAYAEAKELVSDWLDTKLKEELAREGEGTAEGAETTHPVQEASGILNYENFDDLYGYLEEEEESSTVQKFIDHLLLKDVVDSGMMEELGMKENQDQKQQKDPRLTMEMRHKQVKENRLRREKELESQRIEKALKKSAYLEAQCLVQEEKKRKALEAKKQERELEKEMVKLRREIIERRRTVAEAWKTEKKKQEENYLKEPKKDVFESAPLHEGKMTKERRTKVKELLIQVFKENQQCQRRYFSAWHKLILDQRIKLGKAGTLSDWKFQLKVLQAWRDYTRSQKLARETQAMENHLREENRKQQVATEYSRKQVLRHCFAEWQHWHRVEIQKRALALTKEETRKKMDALLEAASLGKLTANESSHTRSLLEKATATVEPSVGNGEVSVVPCLWEKPSMCNKGCGSNSLQGKAAESTLQIPLQNVPLNTPDNKQPKTMDAELSQQPADNEKIRLTSWEAVPMCMGHFHNRHIIQQQLIERQKKKLQEQQKIILELKEKQRLADARWTAAERAVAITDPQSRLLASTRGEEEPKRMCQTLNLPDASSRTQANRSDSQKSLSIPRKNTRQPMATHPILKAMEERASQRAERRRVLAERKKKQEEEKLAQLKVQEEERQKREAEEKIAQLERKREEKRLKKMKELEKQKRIEQNQQLEAMANKHYEMVLLKKKGLEPWKKMRLQSIQNIKVAREHHSLAIQRKCLLTWFQYTQESLARKAAWADEFYSHNLLRTVFQNWLRYMTDLEEKVRTFYKHFLQKMIFRAWSNIVIEAKIDSQSKYKIAEEHNNSLEEVINEETMPSASIPTLALWHILQTTQPNSLNRPDLGRAMPGGSQTEVVVAVRLAD